jgi:hypothetical protein
LLKLLLLLLLLSLSSYIAALKVVSCIRRRRRRRNCCYSVVFGRRSGQRIIPEETWLLLSSFHTPKLASIFTLNVCFVCVFLLSTSKLEKSSNQLGLTCMRRWAAAIPKKKKKR